jgi:hypothetical protein
MKNDTMAATAGRVAGHIWLAPQLIDWAEVARIVLHGLLALAVLTYMAGHALGTAVHRANDWMSRHWAALLAKPEDPLTVEPAVQATAPIVEQAPTAAQLPPAPAPLALLAPARQPVSPADELVELSGNSGQLAPPAVAPLYDDLAHLPVRQLMVLAGTRSKKHRRAELLAMVAAC